MILKGRYYKTLYRKDSFSVCLFRAAEAVKDPCGKTLPYFKVKGINIPDSTGVTYSLKGSWEDSPSGMTFSVSSAEDVLPKSGEGIVRYLQSLDGVGKKTALRIYTAFGEDVFDILDNDIERLLEVKGIRKGTYRRIRTCWAKKSAGKELFSYLYGFHIPEKVIMEIFDRYENFSLHMVRNEPYSLMDIPGFGFSFADALAKDNGLDPYSVQRISAGILEVIREYESGGRLLNLHSRRTGENLQAGNTCITWDLLYRLTKELLEINISPVELGKVISRMEGKSIYIDEDRYFFREETARREMGIAKNVDRLLCGRQKRFSLDMNMLDRMLDDAERKGSISAMLSQKQKEAVLSALTNGFSIITGGPGTGKTMIQKAIIYCMNMLDPGCEILLCAPTGRAARKMSEGAGLPAFTIHSALGMYAEENLSGSKEKISADLVIVDEASMIDTHLANCLFAAVPSKSRVVFVGDFRQLPSVGCGNVLRELITGGDVPVCTLTDVFRQAKGSSIGYNAGRIVSGNTEILTDDSFVIDEVCGSEKIADETARLYEELSAEYGIQDVAVLSPYRRETPTGVNQLNPRLQITVFPEADGSFREGDKVMFTKNSGCLTNGDVGFIKSVKDDDGEKVLLCSFDERDVLLEGDELSALEHAYACTIHKSQGSEYRAVILVVDPRHSIMLRRNLIYTAVTRAREKIIIVGSKEAYIKAIESIDTSVRLSRLSHFLHCRRMKKPEPEEHQLSFDIKAC